MSSTTIDHDEIRGWAESKGGVPAAVDRTHGEDHTVGIIRLMFPKSAQSEHSHLVEISWEEFFEKFEESSLALIYDEKTLFNKLIGRDTADHRAHGEHGSRHHPAPAKHEPANAAAKHEPAGKHEPAKAAAKHEPAEKHEPTKAAAKHEPAEKHEPAKAAAKHAPDKVAEKSAPAKGKSAESDLASREYKDKDGTVHHHTRANAGKS